MLNLQNICRFQHKSARAADRPRPTRPAAAGGALFRKIGCVFDISVFRALDVTL